MSRRDAGLAYAHFPSSDRKKIVVLQNIAERLRERLAKAHKNLPYEQEELGALVWALGKLANMEVK